MYLLRLRAPVAAMLAAMLLSLCACAAQETAVPEHDEAPAGNTGFTVHCFDAGKADAFLLYTPNSAVLIDAGEKGFGKTILAYLEEKGISKLDYLIVTHFDQDHVGGCARVINHFEVGAVLQSNQAKDSEEYEKYVNALRNAGIEAVTVRDSYTFTLDGVQYSVDPPAQQKYANDSSNNSSLIISVRNGENTLLFMGDAMTERIEEFLSAGHGTYDLLKVPHHGKEEPLMTNLLSAVAPEYAVITSSEEEPESAQTVALLEEAGIQVFLTREGALTVHSDGAALSLEREPDPGVLS